jgi:hypothetical protein
MCADLGKVLSQTYRTKDCASFVLFLIVELTSIPIEATDNRRQRQRLRFDV